MDIEQARFNMVEQQIRTWEVLDQSVLDLLFAVHREKYVPPAWRDMAFTDMEIPLGHGEAMLQPKLEARILQELAIKRTDKILEIGSGSGYMTALLAACGALVNSVEVIPDLHEMAKRNLSANNVSNVLLEVGDGARGWKTHGQYDVIVLTGSTPILAPELLQQMNEGGRLFAVEGDAPVMKGLLYTASADGYGKVELFETCIKPLLNAPQPERFKF
ncbi:MAG: protein-L-isoaspartate O-methyltransferase [Burkholderiales bacterium]